MNGRDRGLLERAVKFIQDTGDLSPEEEELLEGLEDFVGSIEEPSIDPDKALEYVETTLKNQTLRDRSLVESLEVVIWDYKRHMELFSDVEEALNVHRLKIDTING